MATWTRRALAAGALVAGVALLLATPLPAKVFRLVHRGLRRHGVELEVLARDRRGLGLAAASGADSLAVTMSTGQGQLVRAYGAPFYRLFASRDADGDGFLTPDEFRDVFRLLAPVEVPEPEERQKAPEANDSVALVAQFSPLQLDSVTKEMSRRGTNLGYFSALVAWRRPHRRVTRVGAAELAALFWPAWARALPVGRPYTLLTEARNETDFERLFSDSTNRYGLPRTFRSARERTASRLLAAFHPRAFPYTRYHPSGSAAVVAAASEGLVKVRFRLHAEFQLNEPPAYPFWFTPSFFLGHVVLARNLSRVLDFHLDVPADRRLNVDMEWVQAHPGGHPFSSNVEVDIGYVPRMALSLRGGPAQGLPARWVEALDDAATFGLLERHLYAFKKVDYLPFPEAVSAAATAGRPLHVVLLWGSLDDQSC